MAELFVHLCAQLTKNKRSYDTMLFMGNWSGSRDWLWLQVYLCRWPVKLYLHRVKVKANPALLQKDATKKYGNQFFKTHL